MNKRFRVCSHDQPFLLPPSLQDWLPENHLARFVADVMNELDLSAIYASYERSDGRGLAAYHPVLMTRLLLYGYCIGMTSSRKIEQATYDNVAFRYLSADQHPDHDTLAAFRQDHLQALADLFVQALRLCQKAGLVKLGNVSIDGTKMKANANAWRSMNYQKLTEKAQHWRAEVARLLKQAQQTDREEGERIMSPYLTCPLISLQMPPPLVKVRNGISDIERLGHPAVVGFRRRACQSSPLWCVCFSRSHRCLPLLFLEVLKRAVHFNLSPYYPPPVRFRGFPDLHEPFA